MIQKDENGIEYFSIGPSLRLYPWHYPPVEFEGWDLWGFEDGVKEEIRENIYFDKPRDDLERVVIGAFGAIYGGTK